MLHDADCTCLAAESAQAEAAELRKTLEGVHFAHDHEACDRWSDDDPDDDAECECAAKEHNERIDAVLRYRPGSRDALDAREEAAFHGGHEAGVLAVIDALPPGIDEPMASVALAGGFSAAEALAAWRKGQGR